MITMKTRKNTQDKTVGDLSKESNTVPKKPAMIVTINPLDGLSMDATMSMTTLFLMMATFTKLS